MNRPDTNALVALLCTPVLRIRTAVLLLSDPLVGKERELAARLGIESVDAREWKLRNVTARQRYLALSADQVIGDIASIVEDPSLPGHCLLVHSLDALLSAISDHDRLRFWDFTFVGLKRSRGLLLTLPDRAAHLFSNTERDRWEKAGRLAVMEKVVD